MGRANEARGEGLPGRGVTVTAEEVLLRLTASPERRVTLRVALWTAVCSVGFHGNRYLQPVCEGGAK